MSVRCPHRILLAAAMIIMVCSGAPLFAAETPVGKTIAEVQVIGLKLRPKEHVIAKMTSRPGKAYEEATITEDVRRLIGTGWFEQGQVRIETSIDKDSKVTVYVVVKELKSIVKDIKFIGAQHLSDDEMLRLADIRKGSAADPTFNEMAAQRIQNKLKDDGRYFATVSVAEGNKADDTRVVFNIVEGPVVKVRYVHFQGNKQVPSDRMAAKLTLAGPLWGTLRLMNSKFQPLQLSMDKEKLLDYLHQLGHLEARVQEEIIPGRDLSSVDITFHIDEGPVYMLRGYRFEGNTLYTSEKLKTLIEIKPGERYDRLKTAIDEKRLETFYGFRGYDVHIKHEHFVVPEKPGTVDIVFRVYEPPPLPPQKAQAKIVARGQADDTPPTKSVSKQADLPPAGGGTGGVIREPDRVGNIRIVGNTVTHQDVILNELKEAGVLPGQVLQYPMLEVAKNNLVRRGIFDNEEGKGPSVTVAPNNFDSIYKDIIVTVNETRTGQFLIGAAVNSNVGLTGSIVVNERNFDILRPPHSLDDFLNGRAFRGGGQELRLEAMPGTQFQRYALTWRNPYLFNSQFGLTDSYYFNQRSYAEYNEDRVGTRITVDRRLDPIWRASFSTRIEGVNIKNVPPWAPPSISDDAGDSFLVGLRGGVTRDTRDSFLFPTSGSLLDIGYEQGLGTYTFPIGTAEYTKFFTTQWLQRNDGAGKHVLSMRSQLSVTNSSAPVYERFYAGGIRSFRGFSFRGVGPNENNLFTGGTFAFLNTLEYQVPLNAKESIFFATFIDHGTVEPSMKISNYRVAAGFGFRVQVPAMGPVPLAFDFAFPINKTGTDRTQVFAFYVGLFGGQ
ncbi:N/A [soil metagenome]